MSIPEAGCPHMAGCLGDRRHAGRVVFLLMCSALCRFTYSNKFGKYFDTLDLEDGTTVEDVCYDEFLI